jgi:hypothetical protein
MIEPDIEFDDIESVLAICNHFQLAAVELSIHQEIIQTNTVAELLFFSNDAIAVFANEVLRYLFKKSQ